MTLAWALEAALFALSGAILGYLAGWEVGWWARGLADHPMTDRYADVADEPSFLRGQQVQGRAERRVS